MRFFISFIKAIKTKIIKIKLRKKFSGKYYYPIMTFGEVCKQKFRIVGIRTFPEIIRTFPEIDSNTPAIVKCTHRFFGPILLFEVNYNEWPSDKAMLIHGRNIWDKAFFCFEEIIDSKYYYLGLGLSKVVRGFLDNE